MLKEKSAEGGVRELLEKKMKNLTPHGKDTVAFIVAAGTASNFPMWNIKKFSVRWKEIEEGVATPDIEIEFFKEKEEEGISLGTLADIMNGK
jgi:hypothetical protein